MFYITTYQITQSLQTFNESIEGVYNPVLHATASRLIIKIMELERFSLNINEIKELAVSCVPRPFRKDANATELTNIIIGGV